MKKQVRHKIKNHKKRQTMETLRRPGGRAGWRAACRQGWRAGKAGCTKFHPRRSHGSLFDSSESPCAVTTIITTASGSTTRGDRACGKFGDGALSTTMASPETTQAYLSSPSSSPRRTEVRGEGERLGTGDDERRRRNGEMIYNWQMRDRCMKK